MQINFTGAELEEYLKTMKKDNDIVRLVDPVGRKVLDAGKEDDEPVICHSLWGRCDRCENCTSLRALQSKGSCYKMEILRGRTYWVHSRFLKTDGKARVVETAKDVTDSLIMDSDQRDRMGTLINNFNQMLISDSLTGVYNRRFLDEHFIPSLKCCHDDGINVNLAFIDMDGFKAINDKYGHSAGDRLLKDVAGFWKLHFNSRTKGSERLVVRFGGDEILVIACGITPEAFAEEIAKFNGEMRKICYYSDDQQFTFDFTFGLASSDELGKNWTWDELIDAADNKMYALKTGQKSL